MMILTLTYMLDLTYLLHSYNLRKARKSLSNINIATVYTTYFQKNLRKQNKVF